ncbi:MAG: YggT family protein [Thermomicrobiales bacterium]|jgi:YggT family protein|nr:YggT family protein [Thermomicrobiales bacterium]
MSDLASLVNFFFTILTLLVLCRALLSWFDPGYRTSIGQILVQITEPLLAPIRSLLPNTGVIDLSPIILILGLQILRQIVVSALQ